MFFPWDIFHYSSMIRYLICLTRDIYIYIYHVLHVVIYNLNSDVIDVCTDVSILNIFTRHFHLKNIFQIFPLGVIESSTWYLWMIDLFRKNVSHTYRDIIMYPDLNDYLVIYLFNFTSLVQAQTIWALATSNGVFFLVSLCWNLFIYFSKNGWKKSKSYV